MAQNRSLPTPIMSFIVRAKICLGHEQILSPLPFRLDDNAEQRIKAMLPNPGCMRPWLRLPSEGGWW